MMDKITGPDSSNRKDKVKKNQRKKIVHRVQDNPNIEKAEGKKAGKKKRIGHRRQGKNE